MVLDHYGRRKYVNEEELAAFLAQARQSPVEIQSFCCLLAETGCRISEALALRGENFDLSSGFVIFESLKKRRRGIFRMVPISDQMIDLLDQAHGLRGADPAVMTSLLWPWARMTGYRHVRRLMIQASIVGQNASPKALRHGFGVSAVAAGVPLSLLQRWLGHADLRTTAIYAQVTGPEERAIAQKLWHRYPSGSAGEARAASAT
ncbi:site-specific integrase [Sphingomonas sp. AP4-R1]|nr:site-specific integrase [Sphingomonas sp. AP4-R1]QJU60431.1 site-specific integrase [Sphingomonas sp. AP4-R1]